MSKQDEKPTVVVFRKWKDVGTVLALFPEQQWNQKGSQCGSYEHVGQHGAASYTGCISRTVPATVKEYTPLK